jgi:hypothetical protein
MLNIIFLTQRDAKGSAKERREERRKRGRREKEGVIRQYLFPLPPAPF